MIEIKVPSPGESITEVQIARWIRKDGDYVEKDEEIAEIDSDKATLTLVAEADGILKTLVKEGETIIVGAIACTIDEKAKKPTGVKTDTLKKTVDTVVDESVKKEELSGYAKGLPSVAAQKLMDENGLAGQSMNATGKGGRVTKGDVLDVINNPIAAAPSTTSNVKVPVGSRNERREKMTMLRKKIAQRLVAVKNETAMLTTFNEIDMSAVMNIRKQYKEVFQKKFGVGLGFMSFFTKAVCEALKEFPAVNARIENEEIIYHDYCDIGIAVSAPKGLMVPVMRNAESMSMATIETTIAELAGKARDGKISIEEMTGGTFTITNGGVFGSMMSTPIINPPQSAILGMHNIVERPVANNGQVVIRPMMYVALSYDHRIIDGRESVGFLVKVKQMIEDPVKMLHSGNDPLKILLEI